MKFSNNQISNITNLMLNALMIICTTLAVVPIILVIIISLTNEQELIVNGYSFFPKSFSTFGYEFVFRDAGKIFRAYGVTIFVSLMGTILGLLCTSFFAYPLSRNDFRYKREFSFFVFFTMLFNGGLVPWYLVYTRMLNLKNTIAVLIVPYLMIPMYILIMRTFFNTTIPDALIEAAKIDGAKEFRVFWQIVVPLSKPAFATIGLFYTLQFWNDWWLGLVFITESKYMGIQYLLYNILMNVKILQQLSQASGGQIGVEIAKAPIESARMAMCIIGIGPIIFAYPFFQKFFVKGLTLGAIKG